MLSQSWMPVRLSVLAETKLSNSVHFVDQNFHLLFTQMTKVQDAHNVCVLQLTGSRQHLLCETNILTFLEQCCFTLSLQVEIKWLLKHGGYLVEGGPRHCGLHCHWGGTGSLTTGRTTWCCREGPEEGPPIWDHVSLQRENMQHQQLSACLCL